MAVGHTILRFKKKIEGLIVYFGEQKKRKKIVFSYAEFKMTYIYPADS